MCDWLMQALGRYSIALTESCRMLQHCLLHRGRQFWCGHICMQKLSEMQHATCPSSHVDIPLRCGRHFDEVTFACKSCRKYSMMFARVHRWTSTTPKNTPGRSPGFSGRKQPTDLKSGEESLTPLAPQFQCCVTAVLGGAFKKNSHSCSGHWEAMFSNIETGGPGLPVDVETFGSMAVFFKNPVLL